MKKQLSVLAMGLALCLGNAFAASHAGAPMAGGDSCEAKSAEKKLAGAAKTSFMKKCEADAAGASCEKSAAEKKLAGAAKTSFMKKCQADSAGGGVAAACEKSAADKKLAGAAKTSHLKKCMEDGKTAEAPKK